MRRPSTWLFVSATKRRTRLVVALCLALSLLLPTGADARRPASCGHLCASSVDGMVYRVLGEFRYTDVIGNPVVAFPFTATNRSSKPEVFAPVPGGFTARLSDGSFEQLTQYEQPSGADPNCFPPTATEPDGLTPLGFRIKPGHTGGPWEICMAISPGQQIVKALLADNNRNLHQPAVIDLRHVNVLPAPLPLRWPLPNPCEVPSKEVPSKPVGGDEIWKAAESKQLTEDSWNSPHASATCTYPNLDRSSTIYVGYVRPPEPSGKVIKIRGWPGAELIDSTEPAANPSYFWAITFKRKLHGHAVWGQLWWRGSICVPGVPADAGAAKLLYEMLGPGPSVSVPPAHHIKNPCVP